MGALYCVPKDDAPENVEDKSQTQGGADGQTPQQPSAEEYQNILKTLESHKSENEKLRENIAVLETKIKGQDEIDDLKENYAAKLEEKSQEINDHLKSKRDMHLVLNQTKQDKLKAEAAASIYKRKLDEDSKKFTTEAESMKRKLEAAEKQVSLRGILLKINKGGHGARVLREVLIFVAENDLHICVAEPQSNSLPRERVIDCSIDPGILGGAQFKVDDLKKLLIISTPKKKIPFLCDDVEQRNVWLATIQSRLPH